MQEGNERGPITKFITDTSQHRTSKDQIIFLHIFPISFTKFRHAAQEILILLTFLHLLNSIKDRIFFP